MVGYCVVSHASNGSIFFLARENLGNLLGTDQNTFSIGAQDGSQCSVMLNTGAGRTHEIKSNTTGTRVCTLPDASVTLAGLSLAQTWTAQQTFGSGSGITLNDGINITLLTTTGSKIGTATTQKLGFWNATPIVQPASTTDLRQLLINVGFLASGGATPLDLNGGAFTTTGNSSLGQITIADAKNVILNTTTGTKWGTGTTQKQGWYNATPVVQQTSASLTNNVTSGGTTDTIANYTDLTVYANDAAAIRNNMYQLARKIKEIGDALRTYGLLG
jgi:hypothetical protein